MGQHRRRNFAIIGLGTFGATIARELTRFDNYVLGIDRDAVVVNRLADELSQVVSADGKDEDAMREIGIGSYDVAVVAMGEDIEGSIVTAITCKVAGVPEVWAKATTKMHHRILSRIGVDRVIHPEEEMGRHIAQMLNNPLVRDYVSLGNGFHVVNIIVPERMAGRKISGLDLAERYDLRCVGVMEGTTFKSNGDEDVTLKENDRLMILGKRADLRRFADNV